jgi:POT family proton-dependent oligopeptide transporter
MATSSPTATAPSTPAPGKQGHPLGLYVLFGTEMWERFSYYGMRALLVLYLVDHHGWQPEQSSGVYKWYTSLVYLTPLFGGFLADRFLGLRASIIAGGVLMAIGHFLMAFEPLPMFYAALAFLIAGNGFFKPNISTLVGKMYKKDDDRRDGAFTIFYMGINLGAFLSPLVCGWLRKNMGFHWGFGAAGVGMVIGLATFLLGQHRVVRDVEAAGNDLLTAREKARAKLSEGEAKAGVPYRASASEPTKDEPSDEEKPGETGIAGVLAKAFPFFLIATAIALPAYYGWLFAAGHGKATSLIMPIAFGAVFAAMAVVLLGIKGAAKDKSIVIFVLFMFVVLFWMAFEQAGNALNLWAEFHTKLSIGSLSYPAEWFQSVNAILIVVLAPLFSMFWLWLARRGKEPRTPVKMFVALIFMALSFAVMIFGAIEENRSRTEVTFTGALPARVPLGKDGAEPGDGREVLGCGAKQATCTGADAATRFDGGRLTALANADGTVTLRARGVLPRYVVNDVLKTAAPQDFVAAVEKLDETTQTATAERPVRFSSFPEGWKLTLDPKEMKEAGIAWDETKRELTFAKRIDAPSTAEIISAGAPPEFREGVWDLEKKSSAARASAMWLFLSYLLATLGELCLSPVGLSMVTKLAPSRFASLFMGVWLLGSSVAQYAGGSIGESWGQITPTSYFTLFVWTSLIGAALLFVLVSPLKKLMREVH